MILILKHKMTQPFCVLVLIKKSPSQERRIFVQLFRDKSRRLTVDSRSAHRDRSNMTRSSKFTVSLYESISLRKFPAFFFRHESGNSQTKFKCCYFISFNSCTYSTIQPKTAFPRRPYLLPVHFIACSCLTIAVMIIF